MHTLIINFAKPTNTPAGKSTTIGYDERKLTKSQDINSRVTNLFRRTDGHIENGLHTVHRQCAGVAGVMRQCVVFHEDA